MNIFFVADADVGYQTICSAQEHRKAARHSKENHCCTDDKQK